MKRIICVWLPNWPITRLCLTTPDCAAPDKPLAIVATSGSKRQVSAINRSALHRGVLPGQRVTDAKAIVPDLVTVAADVAADEAALEALSRWAQRFTPSTAPNPPGGLWLDITGCAKVWGGERRLVETLLNQLEKRGIPCRAAIADTFGAAWAFARRAERYHILPPGGHRDLLPGLPLKALRLSPDTMAGLRRLGLKTLTEVMALPRAVLTGRFPDLLPRLDQAFGDAPETVAFTQPPTQWFETLTFADFIMTPEDLQRAIAALARKLCRRLAESGQGGRRFEVRFFGADNSIQQIAVATSLPNRDAPGIAKLLSAKLEGIDPGFGIEVVTLQAARIEALPERQVAMDQRTGDRASLSPLIDKLGNRLGFNNVWRFALHESHIPERSAVRVAPLAEPSRRVWQNGWARPIRLLSRPELIDVTASVPDNPPKQFRWRRVLRKIRRAEGPERIAPEWWQEQAGEKPSEIRDYYRIEDESGARFWVYREGLYADGAPQPRWFIHGFLA
jgi:protein ImuB